MSQTKTPNFTEEELVQALQDGSNQGFEKIYARFSGVLYGTMMKWVNDSQMAENLLQDVFVKAWANRLSYDAGKGRLFTWLYNIARNLCIDYYRSRQFKKTKAALLSDDIASLLGGTKMTSQIIDTIGIRKLLDMLRKEEKQIVELMYFKGLTQKEIACVMDMPLGTVKTRMSMAIKHLRNFFTNDLNAAVWKVSCQKHR